MYGTIDVHLWHVIKGNDIDANSARAEALQLLVSRENAESELAWETPRHHFASPMAWKGRASFALMFQKRDVCYVQCCLLWSRMWLKGLDCAFLHMFCSKKCPPSWTLKDSRTTRKPPGGFLYNSAFEASWVLPPVNVQIQVQVEPIIWKEYIIWNITVHF